MVQLAGTVCSHARVVLCVGTAAGALAAAAPVLRDALGSQAVYVPGCPPTALAFAASLVAHLLGSSPALAVEAEQRPALPS
jgi:Ni,Fe-hydrogenase I small subunit